jgi:large subunit ribosomal protein L5
LSETQSVPKTKDTHAKDAKPAAKQAQPGGNKGKADKAAAPPLRAKLPKTPKAPAAKMAAGAENPMTQPRIAKVTVNIGVGDGGEKLEKAEKILAMLSGGKPVRTLGKENNRELGVRPGAPIGCKVTLRGDMADDFVRRALYSRKNRVYEYSFDNQGNLQFGVSDYTNFEGQRYDPELGVFGMDVCITMEKPGHRIKHRRLLSRKVPTHHRVSRDEAKAFLSKKFAIEVI